MTGKRKKRKGLILLIVLLIIAAVIWVLKVTIYDAVKEKMTSVMAEKMLEEQIANDTTGQLGNAQDIYEAMSDEDKETVNSLIEDKVSAETISEVSGYVKNKDTEGLKQYVKDEFTEEEIQQIKDLYNKYK